MSPGRTEKRIGIWDSTALGDEEGVRGLDSTLILGVVPPYPTPVEALRLFLIPLDPDSYRPDPNTRSNLSRASTTGPTEIPSQSTLSPY